MTLREFIKKNDINLDYKDRSKIGFKLKFLKAKYDYVDEHNYQARNYEDGFFDRYDVQNIILNHMTER